MHTGKGLFTGFLIGIVLTLVVAALIGFGTVYSGQYNVAATDPHATFVRWAFDTTYHRSIENHAEELIAPETVSPAMIEAGGSVYASTCAHCHGTPGHEPAEWSRGMRPEPPHLTEAAAEWEPEEVFWIVRHGIKMSGMPAFGPRHTDEEIWAIAAFVKQLPGMTSEEYQALTGGAGHSSAAGAPGGSNDEMQETTP